MVKMIPVNEDGIPVSMRLDQPWNVAGSFCKDKYRFFFNRSMDELFSECELELNVDNG